MFKNYIYYDLLFHNYSFIYLLRLLYYSIFILNSCKIILIYTKFRFKFNNIYNICYFEFFKNKINKKVFKNSVLYLLFLKKFYIKFLKLNCKFLSFFCNFTFLFIFLKIFKFNTLFIVNTYINYKILKVNKSLYIVMFNNLKCLHLLKFKYILFLI
eukprot:GHVU01092760.1.p1 GENE.GHVU01092760.1~~GHVU01092760.1.p1  ORF type:complete len:156 (+),score=11.39 GHVU01092760.1:1063-1530(+)